MKNKKADVPYTGVREDVINNANPVLNDYSLNILSEWISERYKIHVKKDILGEPAPWTNCPILRRVKFTNVFRETDRATIWAIKNICEHPSLSYENKILNCILFRLYNKIETCELIRMPINFNYLEDAKKQSRELLQKKEKEDPGYVFYTSAFNTGGFKFGSSKITGEEYIPFRPMAFMEHIINDGILPRIMDASSPIEVIKELMAYSGLGKFLTYQMFVDMTYIKDFPFSENEYTVSGPGCSLGLSFLFTEKDGMNDEECLFWLRDNQDEVFKDLNLKKLFKERAKHDRKLNVMCLENCFCEFSKYYRCKEQLKEGKTPRARVKYDGESSGTPLEKYFD